MTHIKHLRDMEQERLDAELIKKLKQVKLNKENEKLKQANEKVTKAKEDFEKVSETCCKGN